MVTSRHAQFHAVVVPVLVKDSACLESLEIEVVVEVQRTKKIALTK